jgi:hypothetical protein
LELTPSQQSLLQRSKLAPVRACIFNKSAGTLRALDGRWTGAGRAQDGRWMDAGRVLDGRWTGAVDIRVSQRDTLGYA